MPKKTDERFTVMLDEATLSLLDEIQERELEIGQEPMEYADMIAGMVRCVWPPKRAPEIRPRCKATDCIDLPSLAYCPRCGNRCE